MKVNILGDKISLWQWDTGQYVVIEDEGRCQKVHFCLNDENDALVVKIEYRDGNRCAPVPNILLQKSGNLHVYLFSEEENCGTTCYRKTIEIKKRSKPSDYLYTETEVLSLQSLDAKLQSFMQSTIKTVNGVSPNKDGNVDLDIKSVALETMIELYVAPVILDNDGAVLTDSDGAILLNV